jgi:NADPH-dependent 7-cyano-7-deazaguanine reductase QueF
MANPPRHVVSRTLVKRYFKRFLPRMADNNKSFFDEIVNCYRTHGLFNEKCQPIIDKVDANQARALKVKNEYTKLDVQGSVLNSLRKPVYSFQKKGRYRTLRPRQRDIYDGIF